MRFITSCTTVRPRLLNFLLTTALTLPLTLTLGLTLTLSAGLTFNSPAYADSSQMPLRKSERQAAANLARAAMIQQRALPADAKATVIKVEAQRSRKSKRSNARRAVVQIYDYDNNRLLTSTVNLSTKKVSRAVTNTKTQPPLATAEQDRAIQIALADKKTMRRLSRVYQRVTGTTLQDPEKQLKLSPRNFHTDDTRNDDGAEAGDCQRQRCVQLSVVTSDSIRINVVPVINLSSDKVATILRTGPSEDLTRRMSKNARERRKARAARKARNRDTRQQLNAVPESQ